MRYSLNAVWMREEQRYQIYKLYEKGETELVGYVPKNAIENKEREAVVSLLFTVWESDQDNIPLIQVHNGHLLELLRKAFRFSEAPVQLKRECNLKPMDENVMLPQFPTVAQSKSLQERRRVKKPKEKKPTRGPSKDPKQRTRAAQGQPAAGEQEDTERGFPASKEEPAASCATSPSWTSSSGEHTLSHPPFKVPLPGASSGAPLSFYSQSLLFPPYGVVPGALPFGISPFGMVPTFLSSAPPARPFWPLSSGFPPEAAGTPMFVPPLQYGIPPPPAGTSVTNTTSSSPTGSGPSVQQWAPNVVVTISSSPPQSPPVSPSNPPRGVDPEAWKRLCGARLLLDFSSTRVPQQAAQGPQQVSGSRETTTQAASVKRRRVVP